ncbi:MAG: thermonuclease family protein [Prochlorothrix sp.]
MASTITSHYQPLPTVARSPSMLKSSPVSRSRLWAIGLLILLNLGLSQCQRPDTPISIDRQPVRVERVVSAQTVEVLPLRGEADLQTVRLIGLETPPWEQAPWGEAAQRWLRTQVEGQTVELETDVQEWDQDNQRWGYLWQGGELLNGAIITAGHALARPRFPNVRYRQRLQRAQEIARLRGVGIWNPESPLRQLPSQSRARSFRDGTGHGTGQ